MDEQLRQLLEETCKHPPGSLKRQQKLTKLIRLIQSSKKLWQENTPYYEDALQQTWVYFCQNLCEAGTAQKYDPNRSSIITWLNHYLKWRLQDYRLAIQIEKVRIKDEKGLGLERTTDLSETVASSPDPPSILENVRTWALKDPKGELRRIHIQGFPAVTCQVLILRRLPKETSWKELSAEFGIPVSTLSSFYQRQCLPRLRKFGEKEGYI